MRMNLFRGKGILFSYDTDIWSKQLFYLLQILGNWFFLIFQFLTSSEPKRKQKENVKWSGYCVSNKFPYSSTITLSYKTIMRYSNKLRVLGNELRDSLLISLLISSKFKRINHPLPPPEIIWKPLVK